MNTSKFEPGQIVITSNAYRTLDPLSIPQCIHRHLTGDWGNLCEDDRKANDAALKDGGRLLSSYVDSRGTKFWIITEADRSVTTALLPEDY